jgi:hypothetical protein
MSACQQIDRLDRSCSTEADCVAVKHVANCCGTARIIGLRASQQASFAALESQCDASYPACGCATGATTSDDGSVIKADAQAGVTCVQGKCTTFDRDCGQPCTGGTTCFSCVTHVTIYAACTTVCTGNADCKDPSLPMCQGAISGNRPDKLCTAAVTCDTK